LKNGLSTTANSREHERDGTSRNLGEQRRDAASVGYVSVFDLFVWR